ncbi:MAG: zf-HC2 domain-containing protein [Pirellulaceae bacterium]|nr:zf-HC2 domain-containing protein [Pirellulaceae bacterium]
MNKKCHFVREQLSAFQDGELPIAVEDQVQKHLDICLSCAHELTQFKQLGRLANAYVEPLSHRPPAFASISQRLSDMALPTDGTSKALIMPRRSHILNRKWKLTMGALVAVAATALIIAIPMMPYYQNGIKVRHPSIATLDLQPVLEIFRHDAQTAIDALKEQYTLKDVALVDAESSFGHPIFVSILSKDAGLPGNAKVASTKTFSFPSCQCLEKQCMCGPGCCKCVTVVCERPDGSTYLILEQCTSQTVTFGKFPVQSVTRNGLEIQQVIVDGTSTISVNRPTGQVTVIGLRDNVEIDTMLTSL